MTRNDEPDTTGNWGSEPTDWNRATEREAVLSDGGGTPITDVAGIGESYGEDLRAAGVETAAQLLAVDTTDLADDTGITESRIEQWKEAAQELTPHAATTDDHGSDEDEPAGVQTEPDTEAAEPEASEPEAELTEADGTSDEGETAPSSETEPAGVTGVDEVTGTETPTDGTSGSASGTTETERTTTERTEADLEEEILDPEERIESGEKLCHNCNEPIEADAVVCPNCGVGQETDTATASGKSQEDVDPMLAGVASLLIPGAGALVTGQTNRAAMWFGLLVVALVADAVIFFISSILTVFIIGIFGFLLIPLIHIILHPVAAYDAYNQAKKVNAGDIVVE